MNAVNAIAASIQATGYRQEAIVRNYAFADVLGSAVETRTAALAAFTQTPPSYRSAALAVVQAEGRESLDLVQAFRALGAPLLFVVEGNDITVWQVRNIAPPRVLERLTVAELPALFERNHDIWHPDAIHRAKSVGAVEKGYQLDFVDLGLLPAIEGEIHAKLDRLLVETLAAATAAQGARGLDMRVLFRVVFRLIAAKVLQDRGHPYAKEWDPDDLLSVLQAIESYYSLSVMPTAKRRTVPAAFQAAWNCLLDGINFSNISADDLAFVYENTLVTPEARNLFGTHSTPRQVAEYVVMRLGLHQHPPESLKIYEPFAGAGVFLVSALRHLRDRLSSDWTDQQRHDFLVQHLAGDEIDPFACEVATLSLILADYPNHNGWRIHEVDLFEDDTLQERVRAHNVILCNPPFEAFNNRERSRYPIAAQSYSKPATVLNAALDAHPLALGFVLPRPFILEKQFAEQRRRIEELYGTVELVELPDRTFGASDIEAAALIASDPRPPAAAAISLRSTDIADRDRRIFLKTGETTAQRHLVRPVPDEVNGELWIPPLDLLWRHLDTYPQLDSKLRPRWGIRWNYDQKQAWSATPQAGFRRGLHSARQFKQFCGSNPVWLDFREDKLLQGFKQDWTQPKLIMNATRLSRGPWRVSAVVDTEKMLYSQQFFGLWPTTQMEEQELSCLSSVLNGPIANAYLAIHSPASRFRSSAVAHIPIPNILPTNLGQLVADYTALLDDTKLLHSNEEELANILTRIDATVLEAYDLPPRLEQQLLDYFRDAERPVAHHWSHWDVAHPAPGLRLAERLSGRFHPDGNWVANVFKPLPEREAALLREYGE